MDLRTHARRALRAGGFAGLTLGMIGPFVAHVAAGRDKLEVRDAWTTAWSKALLSLFGIRLALAGEPPGTPPRGRGRGRLVVANHRGAIDIGILLSIFGGALVSRADLEHWPILGPAARSVGTIFVDRDNRVSGMRAMRMMEARLAAGDTVCVFPEGTTFVGDAVQPFKAGAFLAASRAEVPVVPVGLAYEAGSDAAFVGESFTAHLTRMAGSRGTRVHVEIGKPIEQQRGERVAAWVERSRAEVGYLIGRARARFGAGA